MSDSRRRFRSSATAIALVIFVSGCSWFTDFKQQPKIDPWESVNDTTPSRGNPQNSVPVFGTVAPGYLYARTPLPGAITAMAGIANPTPPNARSLENGRKYFQINCAACHGEGGKGDGTVTKYGFPGISIGPGSNAANNLTDGYIFGMMRNGRGLMPSYNRIEEPDRWDVVNYLRGLQGKLATTVAARPVGLPGETGETVPGVTQMGPTRPAPYYKNFGMQAGAAIRASDTSRPAGVQP